MGTRYFYTGKDYLNVGTTRYLSINSTLATEIVLTSGFTAIRLYNQGSTPLVWGDSNIAINSGNYLYPSASIEWDDIEDSFSFFCISDSTGTLGIAALTEYRR